MSLLRKLDLDKFTEDDYKWVVLYQPPTRFHKGTTLLFHGLRICDCDDTRTAAYMRAERHADELLAKGDLLPHLRNYLERYKDRELPR